jgi:hypothetical protein
MVGITAGSTGFGKLPISDVKANLCLTAFATVSDDSSQMHKYEIGPTMSVIRGALIRLDPASLQISRIGPEYLWGDTNHTCTGDGRQGPDVPSVYLLCCK